MYKFYLLPCCVIKLCIQLFCVGFVPQMELHSTMPSVVYDEQPSDGKGTSSSKNIKWDKEISFEEAYSALEAKFYSFKKVIGNKNILQNMKCSACLEHEAKKEKFGSGGIQTHNPPPSPPPPILYSALTAEPSCRGSRVI